MAGCIQWIISCVRRKQTTEESSSPAHPPSSDAMVDETDTQEETDSNVSLEDAVNKDITKLSEQRQEYFAELQKAERDGKALKQHVLQLKRQRNQRQASCIHHRLKLNNKRIDMLVSQESTCTEFIEKLRNTQTRKDYINTTNSAQATLKNAYVVFSSKDAIDHKVNLTTAISESERITTILGEPMSNQGDGNDDRELMSEFMGVDEKQDGEDTVDDITINLGSDVESRNGITNSNGVEMYQNRHEHERDTVPLLVKSSNSKTKHSIKSNAISL